VPCEHLFVYGSLRTKGSNAAVLRELGIPEGRSAQIPARDGWALVTRHDNAYPYVVEAAAHGFVSSSILGEVVAVSPEHWPVLDAFEDTTWEYRRQRITINELSVWMYVGHADARALWDSAIISGDWLTFAAGRPAPRL
jgi:gamma-glutamylcyclotransferase (GGCT)/AIG2-like uncharacterized protein YtfP